MANGGTVYRPQIVRQIVDANGGLQRDFEPQVIRELPVDPEDLELVRQGHAVGGQLGGRHGVRGADGQRVRCRQDGHRRVL